jgi:predicted nucleic acid-binding protein
MTVSPNSSDDRMEIMIDQIGRLTEVVTIGFQEMREGFRDIKVDLSEVRQTMSEVRQTLREQSEVAKQQFEVAKQQAEAAKQQAITVDRLVKTAELQAEAVNRLLSRPNDG